MYCPFRLKLYERPQPSDIPNLRSKCCIDYDWIHSDVKKDKRTLTCWPLTSRQCIAPQKKNVWWNSFLLWILAFAGKSRNMSDWRCTGFIGPKDSDCDSDNKNQYKAPDYQPDSSMISTYFFQHCNFIVSLLQLGQVILQFRNTATDIVQCPMSVRFSKAVFVFAFKNDFPCTYIQHPIV